MKRRKAVSLILFALAVAAAGYGLTLVRRGFSALATPSTIEELAATTARNMAVPSEYRQLRNPIMPSTENLRAGMEHFSDHCATCHGNDGGGQTLFGKGLYPKPPDMRAAGTQNKSDGELYYTIENGVRLSGMPAFSEAHTAAQTWRLVLFIRHLPQITAEELSEMKGLNPKMEADSANF
jgi:mono/diheme cytochrome c family protein